MAKRSKKAGKTAGKKAPAGKTKRPSSPVRHFRPPTSEWVKPAYAQVNDGKWLLALLMRMDEVVGEMSVKDISEKTGVHFEAVRRHLKHGPPSAELLKAICEEFKVSADWLLMGRGKK